MNESESANAAAGAELSGALGAGCGAGGVGAGAAIFGIGAAGVTNIGAAATGETPDFSASDSARKRVIVSTRLDDTGTCVRDAMLDGMLTSSIGMPFGCTGAGLNVDGASDASIPYDAVSDGPPMPSDAPPPEGTNALRDSASAVFGDELPSIIAT
jgi:hypothetical protein